MDFLTALGASMLLMQVFGYVFIVGFAVYLFYEFFGVILKIMLLGLMTIIFICTLFYFLFF